MIKKNFTVNSGSYAKTAFSGPILAHILLLQWIRVETAAPSTELFGHVSSQGCLPDVLASLFQAPGESPVLLLLVLSRPKKPPQKDVQATQFSAHACSFRGHELGMKWSFQCRIAAVESHLRGLPCMCPDFIQTW